MSYSHIYRIYKRFLKQPKAFTMLCNSDFNGHLKGITFVMLAVHEQFTMSLHLLCSTHIIVLSQFLIVKP